jgi:prevent-host-death family protein
MFDDQEAAVTETLTATEFKARCLEVLDRVGAGQVDQVVITKRGRPVGVLVAPASAAAEVASLHGFLRGSVAIPDAVDLTGLVADEPWEAERGVPHR